MWVIPLGSSLHKNVTARANINVNLFAVAAQTVYKITCIFITDSGTASKHFFALFNVFGK
jgi:hypothetical protein